MTDNYEKYFLDRLPEFDKVIPRQVSGGDICVVLPLYKAGNSIDARWAKSSLWNIHSFLVNTNLRDLGWDIFVYIDEHVAVDAECMRLLKPAIDAGYVKRFGFETLSTTILSEKAYRLGQCIYPVLDRQFDEYDYVFIWDLDMFCCRVENREKFDLNRLIPDHQEYSLSYFYLLEHADFYKTGKRHLWKYKHYLWEGDSVGEDKEKHLYWTSLMSDCIGKKIDPYGKRILPDLDSGIHRFCPDTITDEFKDFIRYSDPILGDDEGVLVGWALKSGMIFKGIFEELPPMSILYDLYEKGDYMDFRKKRGFYWAHDPIRKGNPSSSDFAISIWKQDLGVNR